MTAPPRDPALPRLPLLLDAEEMTPVLARSLGRAARVEGVRVARVAYKPGECVSVHYRVLVDGCPHDAVARTVAGRDLAARARGPRLLELARQVDGRSPAATPLAYDPDARALLTWLPLDPRLPALAEPPTQLAHRLEHAGLGVDLGRAEARVLSYKPRRRVVLRLGRHVLKGYGTARQYEAAARALHLGTRTAVLPTPRSEAVLPDIRATVQAAVEGAPVSSLDVAAEAGAVLAALQREQLPGLEPAPAERPLDDAARKAALLAVVVPDLAPRVEALARRLGAAIPSAHVLVPAHGDFHAGQLLRRADELLVVDTDALCRAVPSLDLAEYVAAATEADASPWDATEAVADRLFEGYGERPPGFRWHLAAAILVRASHPFHRLEPGWPERTAPLVELAEKFAPARSRKA